MFLVSSELIYFDSCFFFQLVDVVFLRLVVESACFLFLPFVDKECGIVIIDFSTCSYLFDSCAMMRKLILGVLLSFDLIYSDSCFFFQLVDVVFLGLVLESACFLFCLCR